jgi:Relaxase/Mobilisation nuclease domain
MVPVLTKNGRSFKGAAAYYLHDKRVEGEKIRTTGDRIAWTETLNLATDDPDRAWKMMAHTAMAQADLKQAAGVKATGRKLTSPVLAYSLSWHPDERPDRPEQMKAARDTLKAMGLENHQALVVCHNDEPHAHIHILVNRVDPETGVAAGLSNSQLKLSQWALEYEQANGKILCPEREENHKRRQKGEQVDAGRTPRAEYEAGQGASNDNLKFNFVKTEQRQKDAQLKEAGRQMRSSHGRQWGELNRTYGTVRGRMQESTRRLKDKRTLEIKERAKPWWTALFKQQRLDRQNFEAAERGTLGKLWSMAFVFQSIRRQQPDMDVLTLFYTLLSSAQRRAAFDARQEHDRRELSRHISTEINSECRAIDRKMAGDLAKLRTEYRTQCGTLKAEQVKQQEQIKAAWRTRNDERKAAYQPFRERFAKNDKTQRVRQGRGRSIRQDDRQRRPPKSRGPSGPGLG